MITINSLWKKGEEKSFVWLNLNVMKWIVVIESLTCWFPRDGDDLKPRDSLEMQKSCIRRFLNRLQTITHLTHFQTLIFLSLISIIYKSQFTHAQSKQKFRNESKEELERRARKNIVKISDDVNDVDKFRARRRKTQKPERLKAQRIHKVHSLMSGERLELMQR